jgi:hypothetical protein
MDVAHAGDARLFIAERQGRIRILQPDGTVRPAPFLSLLEKVLCCEGEQGFQGLAFHPDYPATPFLFVHYAGLNGNLFISRFHRDG